jgi:cytochrome c-type biogenesis protein CcmH/NrfF
MFFSFERTPVRRVWRIEFGLARLAQVSALVIAVILTTAAADPNVAKTARFDKLGHQIMCSCSCNELLLECNHVGCPNSDGMRQELMAGVDRGDSDKTIFSAFVEKYGPTSLAAPPVEGFNIVGWVMPFAVLILGIGGTALLIRKWRLRSVPMPPPAGVAHFSDIRDRIRRETEL